MNRSGYTAAAGAILSVWVALGGCMSGSNALAADVSPEGWNIPVEFHYYNADTLAVVDPAFTLRHSSEIIPQESRYLIRWFSPRGTLRTDTVRVSFAPAVSQTGRLRESTAALPPVRMDGAGYCRITVTPLQTTLGVWSAAIEF